MVYFVAIFRGVRRQSGVRWIGLAVFVVLRLSCWSGSSGVRRVSQPPGERAPPACGRPEQRILVVANETVGGPELRDAIRAAAGDTRAAVLVVCPALNTKLRHCGLRRGRARTAAEERLAAAWPALEQLGFAAAGEVGDADPLQAIEDALRHVPART